MVDHGFIPRQDAEGPEVLERFYFCSGEFLSDVLMLTYWVGGWKYTYTQVWRWGGDFSRVDGEDIRAGEGGGDLKTKVN